MERAVSIVQPNPHSQDQDTVTKKERTFSWDWSYSLKDHMEDDIAGHKGVFAVSTCIDGVFLPCRLPLAKRLYFFLLTITVLVQRAFNRIYSDFITVFILDFE